MGAKHPGATLGLPASGSRWERAELELRGDACAACPGEHNAGSGSSK